jgi:hypothetical protein
VIPESLVEAGQRVAVEQTEISVDHTGAAGVSALLDPTVVEGHTDRDHIVVFFTGRQRSA